MFDQPWKITRIRAASHRIGLILAVLATASAGPAAANPQGPNVAAGQATVTSPDPSTLQIQQQSDKAIINWQSFDIGGTESTVFTMPSASSVNLSRVLGNNLSEVNGKLQANGRLFLVNPQGIIFGEGASVNVGGLVATTADITNENFMNGRLSFDQASPVPGARIVNNGQISIAERGLAALVAPEVENNGVIEARLGQVVLGGTQTFALDLAGDGLLSFAVGDAVQTAPADGGAAVENGGTIRADGGRVLLTAETAAGVVDNAINMSGVIEARSIGVGSDGVITLSGGDNGLVQVSNTLDASGTGADESGGDVRVTGERVLVTDSAKINASGSRGGGTVLVGGDVHGGGDMPTAQRTLVEQGSQIAADAVDNGNGGTVVVWGDEAAGFNGAISAQGGEAGGDGGLVEVSSKGNVGTAGTVDVTAHAGRTGTWLIDPDSITIENVEFGDTVPPIFFGDNPGESLFVRPISIQNSQSTVILQANKDISVQSFVSSPNNLMMQAGSDIFVNNIISMGPGADLHLEASSPHAPTSDPNGVISFAAPPSGTSGPFGRVIMDGGRLTMIASDFTGGNLSSAVSHIVGTGENAVVLAPARAIDLSFTGSPEIHVGGTDPGARATVTAGEILGLTFDAHAVNIGKAVTAGANGNGVGGQDVTVKSITLDGNVDFADGTDLAFFSSGDFTSQFRIAALESEEPVFEDLTIDAGGSILLSSGAAASTTGDVAIHADEQIVLNASGNIALVAGAAPPAAGNGDILISAGNELTATAGGVLTLDAGKSIGATAINEGFVSADAGRLLLRAGEDIVTQELAIGGDFLSGNVFFTGADELAIQAGRNVTLSGGSLAGTDAVFLEADSPEAPNGSNDGGTLTLGANFALGGVGGGLGGDLDQPGGVVSLNGDLTLIGADFVFDPGAVIAVGRGNVLIAPSTPGQLTLGDVGSMLTADEISLIQSTGEWSLGAAFTAPALNGLQQPTTASSISIGADLSLPALDALLLSATGPIDSNGFRLQTDELSVRAGGDVSLSTEVTNLEVSAPGKNVAIDEASDITVRDVPINLGVPDDEDVFGITAQNLDLHAPGPVTFAVNHVVFGNHKVTSDATVIFQSAIGGETTISDTTEDELTVVSDGPVNFNSSVDGLDTLIVTASGDITFAGNVGSSSPLGNVIIGNVSNAKGALEALDKDDLKSASVFVSNTGGDVSFGGAFAVENLLLKPNGSSSGGNLNVEGLLVSGESADLFGTIQGVGGTPAALLGISEPIVGSTSTFNPKDFTFNLCAIGINCTGGSFPDTRDDGTPPDPGAVPPQAAKPSLTLPELLLTKQRIVPDLEGRFSNSGNEEIW
jgi:filamentous hemagglutinin family protein